MQWILEGMEQSRVVNPSHPPQVFDLLEMRLKGNPKYVRRSDKAAERHRSWKEFVA